MSFAFFAAPDPGNRLVEVRTQMQAIRTIGPADTAAAPSYGTGVAELKAEAGA